MSIYRKTWLAATLFTVLTYTLGVLVGAMFHERGYDVLVDADTGCQYLMTHKGGVTPRLNADGSLFCRNKQPEGGQ